MKWQAFMPNVSDLRIPRYMSCSSNVKSLPLQTFVASLDAYAAVTYLRVDLGNEIRCSIGIENQSSTFETNIITTNGVNGFDFGSLSY